MDAPAGQRASMNAAPWRRPRVTIPQGKPSTVANPRQTSRDKPSRAARHRAAHCLHFVNFTPECCKFETLHTV